METQNISSPTPPEDKTLTQEQIIRAATNSPALAEDQFVLGDRTFKIIDLQYKSYLAFMRHLQPLVKMLGELLLREDSILPEGLSLNIQDAPLAKIFEGLLDYCGETLPEMVALICQQTDKTITAEWVEEHAQSPLQLAGIAMQQVAQNNMVEDVVRFFVLLRPMQKMFSSAKSKTEETP